jgi:hypothetical protein
MRPEEDVMAALTADRVAGLRDPCPPASGAAEACARFTEPLSAQVRFGEGPQAALEAADVLAICAGHLELAMPPSGCHQPGEACQVSFELNGARRVLACTILWFSTHQLVSLMGVGLG